jgi:hypothetical protein
MFILFYPRDLVDDSGIYKDVAATFAIRSLAVRREDKSILGYVLAGQEALGDWVSDRDMLYADDSADLNTLFPDDANNWTQEWRPLVSATGFRFTSPTTYYEDFLESLKVQIYAEIDKRTHKLIAAGFEYPVTSGQMFSLSVEAQHTWTNMYIAKDILNYPITVTTLDEQHDAELVDAAAVTTFYTAMVTTARGHLDSGRELKNTLRDATATTEEEVIAAVTDSR